MLKKRILKVALALACIITLTMPYTTTVLAASLTHESTTAELQISLVHEGGEESSGTLTEEQKEFYDESQYCYDVGTTRVFKIIEKGDTDFSNAFYCLNAIKSFPGITSEGFNSLVYKNVADFNDSTNLKVQSLHLSSAYAQNKDTWTENYKALNWLVNNMYLEKQAPMQKDAYLEKAFADYEDWDLESVKALLTDDDIDVVQQYAIWYFTNNDDERYSVTTLPAVRLAALDFENMEVDLENTKSYGDIKEVYASRQDMANNLYQYLIKAAKERSEKDEVTYPTLVNISNETTAKDENYNVVGPFKITSGTAPSSEYTIKLLDQDEKEITDYKIKISGENNFTDKKINEIFDKEFDIYLPKENKSTTKVRLQLSYSSYETKSTLWETETEEDTDKYQPVILITRENTPHIQKVEKTIIRHIDDLALRKYIVKVNDTTYNRMPVVDVTGLKNDSSTTATYKHSKEPIKVSAGDTVVYEIRVYNEGDTDADGAVIIDALPKGLEIVEDSQINRTYGWEKVATGENVDVYKSEYLKTTKIEGFDKDSDTELDSKSVQIECKIADNAKATSVLTNVAEIEDDLNIDDRDSTPSNNDYVKKDYDTSKYTGDTNNKSDLTDSNYYYKGVEDDDDFEKVIVEGKAFDLSLKKFITKINKAAPKTSREPQVDVTPLKNGEKNAKYTTVKNSLSVKVGDIVTYTIRVYNEGDLAGYAEEVADYLPEGLGFLVGHTTNIDNYWSIPSNSKTVKLETIENAKNNLSVDDFNDIKNLSEVDVVVGSVKLTSNKLKASDTDTKNLINGFDKEKGTKLDYRDIQVACIVLSADTNNNLRNIAEITKDLDNNKEEVTDRDSNPDTVDPSNYPGDDRNEDDHDYELLTPGTPEKEKEFDLSLQKFITGLNNSKVEGREPKISKTSDGKIKFTSDVSALQVANNDLITYTIRVYNEGDLAGYAREVSDNLPAGLEFAVNNSTNVKYGWRLYDKNGNETSNLSQATTVKTDYLSKAKSEARQENNLLKPYDSKADKLDYRDLQIVFKVVESKITSKDRKIKNIAEITDDQDENGNTITDRDSTPNNNKEGEDDIDTEEVYVKYFDLALKKDLIKIIVIENGTTREISVPAGAGLQKVEVHRNRINSTQVKFVYNITVKNEGEIAGYATEIKDHIPEGLEFVQADNPQWTKVSDRVITTNALSNKLLQPNETASVQVTLKWINGDGNFGLKTNVAEISAHKNDSNSPDIDSTPDNNKAGEDDIDDAPVMLEISTGTAPTYIALTTTVLAILTTGIILIKKYVL